MRTELLSLLECPFCGAGLRLEENQFIERIDNEVIAGILLCDCGAYPIVAGIPYLRTGRDAQRALEFIGRKKMSSALEVLLGVSESDADFISTESSLTFREVLERLEAKAEGRYLLYRFSDPTFLASEAVLLALGSNLRCAAKPILDLCGGAGHLTRSLCRIEPGREVILADLVFWKLYLAKRFIAPDCQPVCCNGNEPLPFKRDTFSLVSCADAFHYIWSKRQFAGEMQRLAGTTGIIVLPHLHNALNWNPSEGMPLAPSGYARLFHDAAIQIFDETRFMRAAVDGSAVDFSEHASPSEIEAAPALVVLVAPSEMLFRPYSPPLLDNSVPLQFNPLYQRNDSARDAVWKRTFPSVDYEEEYAACKDYLPEQVALTPEQVARLERGDRDEHLKSLARRRVLLDLPEHYV